MVSNRAIREVPNYDEQWKRRAISDCPMRAWKGVFFLSLLPLCCGIDFFSRAQARIHASETREKTTIPKRIKNKHRRGKRRHRERGRERERERERETDYIYSYPVATHFFLMRCVLQKSEATSGDVKIPQAKDKKMCAYFSRFPRRIVARNICVVFK